MQARAQKTISPSERKRKEKEKETKLRTDIEIGRRKFGDKETAVARIKVLFFNGELVGQAVY